MTTTSDVWTYNPAQMPKQELIETMVGRGKLLDGLVDRCEKAVDASEPPKHILLCGPRGMGKTTILRALGYRVEEHEVLARAIIPVVFPEEDQRVNSVHSFLSRLVELSPAAEDWPPEVYRKLGSEALLEALEAHSGASRAFLLIIDNFADLVDKVINHEKCALVELFVGLFDHPKFLIVAAAINPLAPPKGKKGELLRQIADRFAPEELGDLETQAREVVRRRAEQDGRTGLLEQPGVEDRVRAVAKLCGGNPRYLVELYSTLAHAGVQDIETEFKRFLNRCTAAHQGLLRDLSSNAAAALEAIARRRGRATVREVAEQVTTPDETDEETEKRVRHGLAELRQASFIVQAESRGRERVFVVHPPAFQLWYEMRHLDPGSQRLWLLRFFETGTAPKEKVLEYVSGLREAYQDAVGRNDVARAHEHLRTLLFYENILPDDEVVKSVVQEVRALLDRGEWREAGETCRKARDTAKQVEKWPQAVALALAEVSCLRWGGESRRARSILEDAQQGLERAGNPVELSVEYHLALADWADDIPDYKVVKEELQTVQSLLLSIRAA